MNKPFGLLEAKLTLIKRQLSWVFEGGDSSAFSASMLQIQTAPPAPLGRTIAWSISLFLCIFFVWMLWADFDIVVSASGAAVPSSKTKLVQSIESGRITAIHVKDGDVVEKGAPVITLDPTITRADKDRAEQENLEIRVDIQRLKAQLIGVTSLGRIAGEIPKELLDRQQHLLISKLMEQKQKVSALDEEISRRRAELSSGRAQIQKIQTILPILLQRLNMRERLLLDGFIPELTVIESRLEVAAQQNELNVQTQRILELESSLKGAEIAKKQAQSEFISKTSAEITEAQKKFNSGEQEIIKASYREAVQVLRSPISGSVQQLSTHTVGGVVNPSQPLMTVVPKEGGIEVEAQVLNKDRGFIQVGMPASIKLDAFEFTKYGALDGTIQWIGADAVKDEKLGTYYPVRLILKNTVLPVSVNGKTQEIRVGMAVTADIHIGQRKAYEYFLGPLLKYKNQSLREP
jgi:hemolysin D